MLSDPGTKPKRLQRHGGRGVFRISLNLKPLSSASSQAGGEARGGADGSSCRTIGPERAHTLFLSPAPVGGGNLTPKVPALPL